MKKKKQNAWFILLAWPFYLTYYICIWPFVKLVQYLRRKSQPKAADFDVAGLYYYKDALALIRKETSDWSKTAAQIFEQKGRGPVKVYHWRYPRDVELRPEPNNPREKNAVGVYFADKQIGHIPRESSAQVSKLLASGKISSIRGYISGGEYKQFYTDGSFTVEDPEQDTLRATVTVNYV